MIAEELSEGERGSMSVSMMINFYFYPAVPR
jgi:hypothetical protein